MNERGPLPNDDELMERFFERQRSEVLHRVAQREEDRRFRRGVMALAASAALVALLLGGGLMTGPTGSAGSPATLAWIESASFDEPGSGASALDLFGAWDETEPEALSASAENPLPPLRLELDEELFDEFDFDPFLPDGSEADDAFAG